MRHILLKYSLKTVHFIVSHFQFGDVLLAYSRFPTFKFSLLCWHKWDYWLYLQYFIGLTKLLSNGWYTNARFWPRYHKVEDSKVGNVVFSKLSKSPFYLVNILHLTFCYLSPPIDQFAKAPKQMISFSLFWSWIKLKTQGHSQRTFQRKITGHYSEFTQKPHFPLFLSCLTVQ